MTSYGSGRSGRARPTWSSSRCPTTRPTSVRPIGDVPWPGDTSLLALLREGHVHQVDPDATLEAHDELLFVANVAAEADLEHLLNPNAHSEAPLDCGASQAFLTLISVWSRLSTQAMVASAAS